MATLLNQSISPHWWQRPGLHSHHLQLFPHALLSLFPEYFPGMTGFKSGVCRPECSVQYMAQFIWNSAWLLCLFLDTYVHHVCGAVNTGNLEARRQNICTKWQHSLINQSHLIDDRNLSSIPMLHSYFARPHRVCLWYFSLQWPVSGINVFLDHYLAIT